MDLERMSDEGLRSQSRGIASYLDLYQRIDEGIEPNPRNYFYMLDRYQSRWKEIGREIRRRNEIRWHRQLLEEVSIKKYAEGFRDGPESQQKGEQRWVL